MQRLTHWQHPLAFTLLVTILIIAAGLRFYNLNWDNGIFAHPDERSTVAFYAPTIQWPADTTSLLNPRTSTLNPLWDVRNQTRRSYTYGHFPLYILVLTANFLNDLTPVAEWLGLPQGWVQFLSSSLSGHGFAHIGRALMALADLFTVYLLFLLGRRLYGWSGGLLAAALSAFTVLQIQLAHFFAVDPISTTFTVLAIYGAALLYDRRSLSAAIITGLGIGLAVASKFSALPIAAAPVIVGALALLHDRSDPTSRGRSPDRATPGAVRDQPQPLNTIQNRKSEIQNRVVFLVIVSLAISFVVFAITSPFVLLDFENFRLAVIEEQGNMVSGAADFPFTRQYRNTPAYWYFIEQQLQWGMGWPLGLLALAGTLWVSGKAIIGKAQPGEVVALAWIVFYFGPTGLFLAKFMRYMIPVVPLFTLFGAGLIVALWKLGQRRHSATPAEAAISWAHSEAANLEPEPARPTDNSLVSDSVNQEILTSPTPLLSRVAQATSLALATIALLGSAIWALAFVNGVYGTEHSWVTFARWTYANVPNDSCIAYEHWDDRMPSDIPEPDGNPGAHNYFQPQLPMYDDDSQQKYELIRSTLIGCDYVVLATNRLWRTIPRLPERYPMSTRYYEALFSGELGFELIHAEETPPRLGPLVIDDQPADESFTVYDHPKPMLFKKTRQLTEAEWDALLGNTWQTAIPGYVGKPTLSMRLRGATSTPGFSSSNVETQKSLLLDRPVDKLPVVNDFHWNSLANNSTVVAVLFWGAMALLIGFITFPLTFLLCQHLPDRGYALSKSLGILLVSYFVWINSSLGLLGNTAMTAYIGLIFLLGFSLWITVRQRHQLVRFWGSQQRVIISAEVVFGLVYLFFVYLRLRNPDLWQPWLGGEKMLEIGFLNAIVKSASMPPYDPFFAGGIINYYYYGLFIAGVFIKLTGIQPSIAFNLAVPTLAALTATNVFSLAGNLALTSSPFVRPKTSAESSPSWGPKSVGSGLLAVLFVAFIGNLEGAAQFMRNLSQFSGSTFQSAIPGLENFILALSGLLHVTTHEATIATYNYWDPTRVIPETINEFPYFSFLFADLHPHMIGIPITVLCLSLAYNRLRAEFTNYQLPVTTYQFSIASLLRWLALPFVLGAVGVINTWDLPTYLGLIVAVYLLRGYRQITPFNWRDGLWLAGRAFIFAGLLAITTYLLYAPFFIHYQPPAETGLGLVSTQTPLDQHLKIWGFFLFIVVSWLLISLLYPASRQALLRAISLGLRRWNVWPHLNQIYRRLVQAETDAYQLGLWSLVAVLLLCLLFILSGYSVPAYLLPLVFVALLLLLRPEISTEVAYLGLLIFTGLLVLLGVEFFFLRDFLGGGEYFRMNTLFKFYIQVWIMFGIAAAVALPHLWSLTQQWRSSRQMLWQGAVLLLLLATLIYPIFGTRTRLEDRFPGEANRPAGGTLDGLAYMTVGMFDWNNTLVDLKYDYEAIRWLQDNVPGTPIIAEAKVGYYREGGMRVAAYTGLPSILGGLHQNEQRPAAEVGARDQLVNDFWSTADLDRTQQLIDQLDISYIYIGQVERATHGPQVGDKFEQLAQQGALEVVFENEQTKIYHRIKEG